MKPAWQWLIEAYGWYGAVALLLAYTLLSLSVIEKGVLYQLLNFTGATGVGIAALTRRSYQATVLEFVWAAVALFSLVRLA